MLCDSGLLVRILAAQDAVWLPMRRSEIPFRRNIESARKAWRGYQGVMTPCDLFELIGPSVRGDVILTQGGRYVRLTDQGEDRARALCALPSRAESFDAVRKLVGEDWVDENDLGADRRFVEMLMLPALQRGFVEAKCGNDGQVFYRRVGDPPEVRDDAGAVGVVAADAELSRLYQVELLTCQGLVLAPQLLSRRLA
jgi:hypothetical protein